MGHFLQDRLKTYLSHLNGPSFTQLGLKPSLKHKKPQADGQRNGGADQQPAQQAHPAARSPGGGQRWSADHAQAPPPQDRTPSERG